jgi:hypothetical protein
VHINACTEAFLPRVARPCVRALSDNPRLSRPISPVALFLSLIPFHSPMRRAPRHDLAFSSSFALPSPSFGVPPSFHSAMERSCSSTTPLCDYSRYTPLTQLCRGPYDVSLTLPTPRGTRHYQRCCHGGGTSVATLVTPRNSTR